MADDPPFFWDSVPYWEEEPKSYREALLRLRTFPWDWYGTLTFGRYDASLRSADKGWMRFARKLAHMQTHWSRRDRRKNHVPWLRAVEPHELRGGTHVHFVVGGVSQLVRPALEDWWSSRYGRCEIVPYNPRLGGVRYVIKKTEVYLQDPGAADVSFSKEVYGRRRT